MFLLSDVRISTTDQVRRKSSRDSSCAWDAKVCRANVHEGDRPTAPVLDLKRVVEDRLAQQRQRASGMCIPKPGIFRKVH